MQCKFGVPLAKALTPKVCVHPMPANLAHLVPLVGLHLSDEVQV